MTSPSFSSKRPNIFDLEKISGFSRSTISRAFNPGSVIRESTREQIMKVAQEIGYSPHAGARTIRSKRMNRWGLLVPHLQNPYYADLVEACDQEARRRGTTLVLGLSHYDSVLINDLLRRWAGGETDGLILDSPRWEENGALMEKLRERHVPIVCLHFAPPSYHLIKKWLEASFRLAMQQLLELGHRRIAYLGQAHETAFETDGYLAYRTALYEHGIPLQPDYLYFGSYGRKGGVEAWQKWRGLAARPTAVLAFNDVMACGLWRAAQLDGYVIPRDLSIIGNDDISEASQTGLSTIRHDQEAFVREIFDVLEAVRLQPDLPTQIRRLPTDLVSRRSVATPPAS
jgi:DNA-binding LacI/PurR family transcriptional regulator